MSKTKNTLMMILKQQIQQLQPGVAQMDEESLVKQVAKNKIIYNLSKKENALQLVYSYIALSDFYSTHQLYEPAIKEILETGDALYLTGVCLYKLGKKGQAYKILQKSLEKNWIQPSIAHQQANQLECVNYLQKIEYERMQKHPEKRKEVQDKLIDFCYQKINIIKRFDKNRSDNYYLALAMGDLTEIYTQFNESQAASQKIKTAIKLMKGQKLGRQKLIQFYLISAKILERMSQSAQSLSQLKNAIQLIEETPKEQRKFNKTYQDIYYMYIKKTLNL